MNIVCLYQNESDTHNPQIVGYSADEYIVMIGAWRRTVTSFEVFRVDKSLYYLDDEKKQHRMLVCSSTLAPQVFKQIVGSPKEVLQILFNGWMVSSPLTRRGHVLSLLKKLYVPILCIVLCGFWIANLRVSKTAFAPANHGEDRNREYVYLALEKYVKESPVLPEEVEDEPKSEPRKTKVVTKSKNCSSIVVRTSLDSDVQKFLSPRFSKSGSFRKSEKCK